MPEPLLNVVPPIPENLLLWLEHNFPHAENLADEIRLNELAFREAVGARRLVAMLRYKYEQQQKKDDSL